ncbi:MAG: hypothetical protein WKF57_06680 [Nakamurella sp.]
MADLIAEIREEHTDFIGSCNACDKPWPCASMQLADELERLRAALTEPRDDTHSAGYRDSGADRRGVQLADCAMPSLPSPEEIEAGRTPAGGFTRAQAAAWGVPWPLPKGWKKDLERAWRDAHAEPLTET